MSHRDLTILSKVVCTFLGRFVDTVMKMMFGSIMRPIIGWVT